MQEGGWAATLPNFIQGSCACTYSFAETIFHCPPALLLTFLDSLFITKISTIVRAAARSNLSQTSAPFTI
jgi:hypothetical protein